MTTLLTRVGAVAAMLLLLGACDQGMMGGTRTSTAQPPDPSNAATDSEGMAGDETEAGPAAGL